MPNDKMSVMNNKYIHNDNVHPGDAMESFKRKYSESDMELSEKLKNMYNKEVGPERSKEFI